MLRPKIIRPLEEKTGIYKIKCSDCKCFYIGQTGRSFLQRFKEHVPKKDLGQTKSNFGRHLMDSNHNYTNLATNLAPLHVCKKGRYMDAAEEFEIYKAHKLYPEHLLNDHLNFHSNALYDTALQVSERLRLASQIRQ